MKNFYMKSLKIGNLTARLPIIQGGMGIGVSLNNLASAVANEGGIGVISAAGIGFNEPDFAVNYIEANIRALKKEIKKAREKTKGIIGVNIMVALSNFTDMVKTAIDEGIDIIFSGAGLPLSLPKFLNGTTNTKIVPIVSSGRAANLIAKKWFQKYNYAPDAVVVEGPMAGGHLGYSPDEVSNPTYSLEKIVKNVIDEMKSYEDASGKAIPVIAAGGIYTGEDIYRFLSLGASGVQMATRFVATDECDASTEFKNAYINCEKDDIDIIKSPVGMPGRAIINQFLESVKAGEKKPYKCLYHCITPCDYKKSPYCIARALINAQKGFLKNGFAFAGANAFRIDKIISVKELIKTLINEYVAASQKNGIIE
ncbi:nitronate monooxygenase family protein [Thermoanaerobacterium sp. RBIITD]|uniref:NAD(P)H-dependent flavin oxidoreductase n=1 Tax=Thermoanaerobacterium sp. RBIITD TaxID=1550240 RepID=UPI000BC05363|nr:nitronate monooxygenase family protein [Thermoanaerobacterium sp. RBIITD]SNX53905.1 NAD(P)H-dependent flavin oxidoreductase YrpB, nitropropane dioxygenase family [Thermoanaerobacterium sp. RBIITD]